MASKASSTLLAASSKACNHASRNWRPRHTSQRNVASAALPEEVKPSPASKPSKINYRIRAAVLLNRSPILTRTPTPFEAAHYEYNARIARALFNPFPVEFYFKAGSILEKQFMREESQREHEAFRWKKPLTEDSDAKESESEDSNAVGVGALAKTEEAIIMPRSHEADRKGDVKSLDRKGQRNLYLLVKKGKGRNEWRLPGGVSEIQEGELLHEAAKRDLHAECGVDMDTWIVGRQPIGFMDDPIPPDSPLLKDFAGAKIFFFKAHIFAGQVNPAAGSLADFAWLTKAEVKRAVTPEYWTNIRDILSDF